MTTTDIPQQNPTFDVFIIGGGVNGCGIARDAAGRGLSVALAEKDDLAQGLPLLRQSCFTVVYVT